MEPPLAPIELLPSDDPVEPDEADGLELLEPVPEPLEPMVDDPVLPVPDDPVEPEEADGLELLEPVPDDEPIVLPPDEPVDPLEEPMVLLSVPLLALPLRFMQGEVLLVELPEVPMPLDESELPVPDAPMPPVDESEPVPVVPAREPVVPPRPELPMLELPVPVLPVLDPLELGLELELLEPGLELELEPDVPPELPDDDWACTATEATASAALAATRASLWVVMVMWMVLRSEVERTIPARVARHRRGNRR